MLIPGQEEVSPCSLGPCLSVSCPEEGESQWPLWGPGPAIPPSRGSQGRGSCDCSLGLERKLFGGMGGVGDCGGRGWPALKWEVEIDFPLMEGEERAEGGGFLGKPRDESPRDRRVEGGEDMGTSHAEGPCSGRAATMENRQCSSKRNQAVHHEDTARGPLRSVIKPLKGSM